MLFVNEKSFFSLCRVWSFSCITLRNGWVIMLTFFIDFSNFVGEALHNRDIHVVLVLVGVEVGRLDYDGVSNLAIRYHLEHFPTMWYRCIPYRISMVVPNVFLTSPSKDLHQMHCLFCILNLWNEKDEHKFKE